MLIALLSCLALSTKDHRLAIITSVNHFCVIMFVASVNTQKKKKFEILFEKSAGLYK